MRPVTVLPRRMAGGGSISRTRTAKVPVTGSARGETSRTRPIALTCGFVRQRDGDVARRVGPRARPAVLAEADETLRIERRAVLDLRRHVEHRVARALARHLHDHAPGRHHLAGLAARAR